MLETTCNENATIHNIQIDCDLFPFHANSVEKLILLNVSMYHVSPNWKFPNLNIKCQHLVYFFTYLPAFSILEWVGAYNIVFEYSIRRVHPTKTFQDCIGPHYTWMLSVNYRTSVRLNWSKIVWRVTHRHSHNLLLFQIESATLFSCVLWIF